MYCQGLMQRGFAPLHIDRNGYHVSFEAVPAWICTQCGASYIEEPEVQEVQSMMEALDKSTARLKATTIPVAA
jgi:YgiT-type zinc finger domain-containing protein